MRYTALFAAIAIPATLVAQPSDTLSQRGRSLLAARFGMTGSAEASASSSQTTARASGFAGSLSYTRFVMSSVAIEISGSLIDANASASAASTDADAVSSLLLGLVYSPAFLAMSPAVRPFLSAAAGPYFHNVSGASATPPSVQSTTQSQPGGRLGAGVNFFLARHFALQMVGDYHMVEPFEPTNGEPRDPSGLSLSFGFAFAWGSP